MSAYTWMVVLSAALLVAIIAGALWALRLQIGGGA